MPYIWGLIGVLIFSLTLPATRLTIGFLDPVFVGLGRAVVGAVLAGLALAVTRSPWPSRAHWPRLAFVAAGGVLGFPMFSAWAMQRVPSGHGAIVVGLIPLATAGAGAWLAGERPSARFWAGSVLGSGVVLAFALWRGGGAVGPADGLLVLAVLAAALGYAHGGILARTMGGWRVISWSLLLALPVTLPLSYAFRPSHPESLPLAAWIGFAYVGVFSSFLGFVAWYRALAQGGIARVGQVQLLQVFFTLAAGALLLGESISWVSLAAAALVVLAVLWGRRA
jgi:drug/metabolite transporter (DMT)-like permease